LTSWGEVGRNAPCPCGSGRKYKHCHGDLSSGGTSEPDTDEEFVYTYKPSPKNPIWQLRLRLDALEWTDGQDEGRIFYDQVGEVLLRYVQGKMHRDFFTEIRSRGGVKLSVASVSFEKGIQEHKDGAYADLSANCTSGSSVRARKSRSGCAHGLGSFLLS
jgi:hypothetical protein